MPDVRLMLQSLSGFNLAVRTFAVQGRNSCLSKRAWSCKRRNLHVLYKVTCYSVCMRMCRRREKTLSGKNRGLSSSGTFVISFYKVLTNMRGRESSVGIATCYGLNDPGIESRWGKYFLHPSRPALGSTQPPLQWVPGLSRGGKAVRAWRWPPTSI